jgi:hypothetical protein
MRLGGLLQHRQGGGELLAQLGGGQQVMVGASGGLLFLRQRIEQRLAAGRIVARSSLAARWRVSVPSRRIVPRVGR